MKNLELYIHIPFCEKKCNYCDFVSFNENRENIEKYIHKLLSEIKSKSHLGNNYIISSIYIGGGTPSFIDSKFIVKILEQIFESFTVSDDCEISIEGNPNSLTNDKLSDYKNASINRLSIGVQSADDNDLETLGRIHNFSDFLNAYNNALHLGFNNINVDVINGIPNQSPESYKKSLKKILMLNPKHISIYNLIIEPNTKFYEMKSNNELVLPLENDILAMDAITKELTEYYNLKRYEISNYSKPGFECKHNLGYWSNVPYLGFGLNSSSYINNTRYKNKTSFTDYLSINYDEDYQVSNDKSSFYDEIISLSKLDLMSEYVMLGLRKTSGINTKNFYNEFNEEFERVFKTALKIYQSMELINRSGDNYYLTDKALDVSNSILCDFLLN